MSTVGTLTSLQSAAALSIFKGYGFAVNSNFNSNVILYSTTGLSSHGGNIASLLTLGNSNVNVANASISYTGRFGSYYDANITQSLGADTIPAITQTIPSGISGFSGDAPGNVTYQIDRACARALGSNTGINLGYFISTFFSVQGYTIICNKQISAVNNSNSTSFSSYGVNDYAGLTTQGWDRYQIGNALPTAFNRIGSMTDAIQTGKFGTPNAVAYVLVNSGLGAVGDLSTKLTTAEVNENDLLNSRYTDSISYVLSTITDSANLATVQQTLGSNITNISSLLDYTNLEKCAAMTNDSDFESFEEVGVDLFKKSHNPSFQSGSDVARLISLIQNPNDSRIETLSSNTALLNSTVVSELKNYLPSALTSGNISFLNVIGTPSGYYNANLVAVITGLANLNSTAYGTQISTALDDIYTTLTDPDAPNLAPYYGSVSSAVGAYNSLMNTIMSDSSVGHIVEQINSNYATICSSLYNEYSNWTKANFITTSYTDQVSILSFAQSLAQQGQDFQNTGSGYYLAGTVSDDVHGSTIRAVLIEGKNYQRLQAYGISPNGYVG